MTVGITGQKFAYAGDGATTTFAFPRPFMNAGDLHVVLADAAGAETLQALGPDYTVTSGLDGISSAWATATAYGQDDAVSHGGAYYVAVAAHTSAAATEPGTGALWTTAWKLEPVENGGEVAMASAPPSGTTLIVTRRTGIKQETDYQTGGAFSAEAHEDALDKLILIAQDLQEQIDRALRLRLGSGAAAPMLPEPAANKALVWDAGGTGLENGPTAADIAAAAPNAADAAASASAAAALLDSFDDRYLGAKSANPALDNDGDALITGALYWNTGAGEMRAYNGASWDAIASGIASVVEDTSPQLGGDLDMNGNLISSSLVVAGTQVSIDSNGVASFVADAGANMSAEYRYADQSVRRWQTSMHETNHNFYISRYDSSGVWQDQTEVDEETGNWNFPSGMQVGGTIKAIGYEIYSGGAFRPFARGWTSNDADIDGLIGGSNNGHLIEGARHGHFTIGIRGNDAGDGFQIISKDAGGPDADYALQTFALNDLGFAFTGTNRGLTLDIRDDGINPNRIYNVNKFPDQPAFLAFNGSTDSNVVGDGSLVQVEFETEAFDNNGNYDNATDTFTAPVDGVYQFHVGVTCDGITSSADHCRLVLQTSNRTYQYWWVKSNDLHTTTHMTWDVLADMDEGDTAYVQFELGGEGGNVGDIFGAAYVRTYFSGMLAA